MESIKRLAINLIISINNLESDTKIQEDWNNLAECINSYDNYDDIPDVKYVSEAIYLYVRRYTNNNEEEERIRDLIAFCLLKRTCDETEGTNKSIFLIMLTLLLSAKKKYLLNVFHYMLPQEEIDCSLREPSTIGDKHTERMKQNYNVIKLYIYKRVNEAIPLNDSAQKLVRGFNDNSTSFINRIGLENIDDIDFTKGAELLNRAYEKIINLGKYQLYISSKEKSEIYKKSRGLIKDNFVFHSHSYTIVEGGWQRNNHIESYVRVSFNHNEIEINNIGIDNQIIRRTLKKSIRNITVDKFISKVEFQFDHKVSRGDGDDVPMVLTVSLNKDTITELVFDFIVGDGHFRHLIMNGMGKWSSEEEFNTANIDFNFNLGNTIPFDLAASYLPVRAMTANNMGKLGNVAIIGCNPVKKVGLGQSYDIIENENTEYFVFPLQSNLYEELKLCVLSMESWQPDCNAYKTIEGYIHGELKKVHIDKLLY